MPVLVPECLVEFGPDPKTRFKTIGPRVPTAKSFYRVHATTTWSAHGLPIVHLHCVPLPVLRETEHCVWIIDEAGEKRRCSKTARASYAYATPEDALNSFYHRRKHYVERLKNNLEASNYMIEQLDADPNKKDWYKL